MILDDTLISEYVIVHVIASYCAIGIHNGIEINFHTWYSGREISASSLNNLLFTIIIVLINVYNNNIEIISIKCYKYVKRYKLAK